MGGAVFKKKGGGRGRCRFQKKAFRLLIAPPCLLYIQLSNLAGAGLVGSGRLARLDWVGRLVGWLVGWLGSVGSGRIGSGRIGSVGLGRSVGWLVGWLGWCYYLKKQGGAIVGGAFLK